MKSLGKLLFFKPNYISDPIKQETPYPIGMAGILPHLFLRLTQ